MTNLDPLELLDEYDPDPAASWPPPACPSWCRDEYLGTEPIRDRVHHGEGHDIATTVDYGVADRQIVDVTPRQAEGRAPFVQVEVLDHTILMTTQEAAELARALVESIEAVIGDASGVPA